MVSGLVTSPEDQDRICLDDARPISIASKLLMSIKVSVPSLLVRSYSSSEGSPASARISSLPATASGSTGSAMYSSLVSPVVPASPSTTSCSSASSAAPSPPADPPPAAPPAPPPRPAAGAHAGEVDAELLGGPQQVVVLVAHLGARALLGDHVDVERQRLHLLQEHLEGLGDRRLGDVLALDDRLVGLHAPDGVVGLDREHLLQRVGGAVGLQGPDLHLAEALAAELSLAAQRLLGDERVGAGRASVDLVVDEVQQLEDVHVADRDFALVGLAGATIVELGGTGAAGAGTGVRIDRQVDSPLLVLLPLHERGVDVFDRGPVEHGGRDVHRLGLAVGVRELVGLRAVVVPALGR